ncbi:hypothetical protein TI39_contig316g00002 [Zymoseptoria brevis]|uniref:Uncharacterized protein n=1 Tax=Zymoseptoria brevis TaxID=1047168 RepID=A0A0F4GUF4_9PEZI|nr:hypothetical protein TI39_contig316g00002 [Zymoseptoria brevis]
MPQDQEALDEFRAAERTGDTARVRQLFTSGRLDAWDASAELKHTPRDPQILRCLLENGADAKGVNFRRINSGEILRVLAEFGFDIKTKCHLVLHNFVKDPDTIDWPLDQGVDVNATDTRFVDDGIPLAPREHDYSNKLLNLVAATGNVQLLDHLVGRGADVHKSLALHYAASPAMISCLLDHHHMDINADSDDLRDFFHASKDSGTPLCSAIFRQNLPVVEELLSRGADPKRAGKNGDLPVLKAVGDDFMFNVGFLPALKPLLDAGADEAHALRSAVRHGKVDAAKVCLEAGADATLALKAAHERKASIAKEIRAGNATERQLDRQERNGIMIKMLESSITNVLTLLSIASFAPQVRLIRDRGDLAGISPSYILYNLLIATFLFATALHIVTSMVPDLPPTEYFLDIGQFAVVWVGQLALFCLSLTLPTYTAAQKRRLAASFVSFTAITLAPTIFEAFIPKDDRIWYTAGLDYLLFFLLAPIMQLLGLVALHVQVRETKSRTTLGALSVEGLYAQTLVFTLGASMVFRVKMLPEYWDGNPSLPPERNTPLAKLWMGIVGWYEMVGWATLDNLIFAFAQGSLWWIARRQSVGGGFGERGPLLEG